MFCGINNTLINTFKCSQRRGIIKNVFGMYSCSVNPSYFLFSTRKAAVKFSICGCLTRSYGEPTKYTIYPITIRTHATTPDCENPEPKLSLYQRFKSMYRDYWYVLLPVHMITSAAWYAGFYYVASSGVDIVALLESMNVSDKIIDPLRNGHSTTGYLAIAFALYKLATPLRYTVTVGGTTVTINYLKKRGFIKPVPSKEKLKEMYEGKKEIFREKGQTMMKSLKQTASKKPPNQ